ncbi:hypothetical protein, partial [Amycolatopsis sp. La24]|uniref:hypothetical protein n=1 Tax=Amycolatopsis sp. La24 TaxID=3028304 RepID=UPI0023B0402D
GNPDVMSESPHHRVRARWPAPQRRQRTASTDEHREVPVSDPAEIAEFSDAAQATDDTYVELSADPLEDGEASQVELDVA